MDPEAEQNVTMYVRQTSKNTLNGLLMIFVLRGFQKKCHGVELTFAVGICFVSPAAPQWEACARINLFPAASVDTTVPQEICISSWKKPWKQISIACLEHSWPIQRTRSWAKFQRRLLHSTLFQLQKVGFNAAVFCLPKLGADPEKNVIAWQNNYSHK